MKSYFYVASLKAIPPVAQNSITCNALVIRDFFLLKTFMEADLIPDRKYIMESEYIATDFTVVRLSHSSLVHPDKAVGRIRSSDGI